MAGQNDGACANPKQIRTDLDCRAARSKFNKGAWSPAKISDVTGRLALPLHHAGRKQARQRRLQALADGLPFPRPPENLLHRPYGNGRDGTFSLADARRERNKAKDLLKEGKDPSIEKQLDKHRKAAARPFAQWPMSGSPRRRWRKSSAAGSSQCTLNKRLRLLGIDTKTDHCAPRLPNHLLDPVSPRGD